MFNYNDLKSLHLEITNRCQASCPMCSRNYHGGQPNPRLRETEWTLADFKNIVHPLLDTVKNIMFCGNFGDPLINADLHLMTDSIKHKDVFVDIHTNGSLRNTEWWSNLPKHLPRNHRVVFAIDGLQDTHAVYRVGTDFNKILDNAKVFIRNGGIAEWSFIKFKHNEHQVLAAHALADTHGFKYFSVKESSRFNFEREFSVLNASGETTHQLEPPKTNNVKYFDVNNLDTVAEIISNTDISCYAKHKGELYIDAHRNVMPCCFLAAIPYDYYRPGDTLAAPKDHIRKQYLRLIADLGNTNANQGVRTVLESAQFQQCWEKYWTINKLWTCARTCGNTFNNPNDQVETYHEL
jgi:MoaA/NifB/PqqE/SkfB family radical SAM enzyme